MNRNEIRSLTGLRGIAALIVMFYHFNSSKLLSGPAEVMLGHGYLMVDLFLVLSGFIIAMTYGHLFEKAFSWSDYALFLTRRLARIYPLYAVSILTAGTLVATSWMDHWPGPPIPVTTVIDLTMLQSLALVPSLNTPGWSISAEWTACLLFPLLVMLCLRRSWGLALLTAGLAFAILPILTILPALEDEPKRAGLLDIWHYDTAYPVVRCVAGFTLGMVTYRLAQTEWVRRITAQSWLSAVILAAILGLMSIKQADVWIVALFPLFILSLAPDDSPVARILGSGPIYRLGILSYGIYLIHNQMNYFMLELAKELESLGFATQTATAAATLAFVALVIILTEFTYRLIERPARNAIYRAAGSSFIPKDAVTATSR